MQYEPLKKSLGKVFSERPFLRILFYKLLNLLLLRTWHIKRELKKIKNQQGENACVLDAGSGFGQYSYYMSTLSKNWHITGIDIIEDQVADCNKFFNKINLSDHITFEDADLTKYINPNYYNLILSVDVMEHIYDDTRVFRNFYESLKTGGMLLISTPSDQGGSDIHEDHKESFIAEHVRQGYNIIEISDKLKSIGFPEVETEYSYGIPGSISWKLSMKAPIILLNVSKLFFLVLPVYYLVIFPFCLLLNYFDVRFKHKTGTGLIIKARK